MIIFLHGTDEFLVGRRKRALMEAFLKKYPGADSFVVDFEDQRTLPDIKRALALCQGGLFAPEKLMVFLHPFSLEEAGEKQLLSFLKEEYPTLSPETILLFVHPGKIKKTHPVTKKLLSLLDKEEQYDALTGKALENFVTKELTLFNGAVQFRREALELFLTLTAPHTARMVSELEKLATFREAGFIEKEDVALLLQAPEESAIFQALDALGRGERKKATLLFRQEAGEGEGVYAVLAMCAWQVRRLLLVRATFDQGIRRASDIAVATKLPPFTVQKALAVIEHFPLPRIKQGITLLSDIDTALKQGKADPGASLDLFVWKL